MKSLFRIRRIEIMVVALVFALSTHVTTAVAGEKTAEDFVKEAKEKVCEITVAEAKKKIDSGAPLVILDVREPEEFKEGHIPKAINIPRGLLEFKVPSAIPDKDAFIIAYCMVGGRSCLACSTLLEMGYKNAVSIAGGWQDWVKAGYPVE